MGKFKTTIIRCIVNTVVIRWILKQKVLRSNAHGIINTSRALQQLTVISLGTELFHTS